MSVPFVRVLELLSQYHSHTISLSWKYNLLRKSCHPLEQASFQRIKMLPHLPELRYGGVGDATEQLGSVAEIREAFVGFQQYLY
jgi:hypothetical protein